MKSRFLKCRVVKVVVAASFATLVLAVLAILSFSKSYSQLEVRSVDAYTLSPVYGVRLFVPELNRYYDCSGSALINGIDSATISSITIAAHADGYVPFVLYNVQLNKIGLRKGPVLYLFKDGESSPGVISMCETPTDESSLELLETAFPDLSN